MQSLHLKDLSELRPEFADQAFKLRRKIFNKLKPKTMKGKQLSGEMIAKLLETYCDAINSGSIFTIESAWTLMCRYECEKVYDASQEQYDKTVRQAISYRFPLDEEDLKQICKDAK